MAANTAPIFTLVPRIGVAGAVVGPTALTSQDGTSSSSNAAVVWTAGTNGSWLSHLKFKAAGSPAATVARVFICSAGGAFTLGTTNTAANTALYQEIALPALTVSQTAATPEFIINLSMGIGAGQVVFVAFGTSTGSAGTGYGVTLVGGDY